MHNNYYVFRQLSQELESKILGFELLECFSQSKDELILGFGLQKEEFYIKASLKPEFSCLSFPNQFARTKSNSIDLFTEYINQKVTSIQQYENERCFTIHFENDLSILFKMHGNRSNIIGYKNQKATKLFRNSFPQDIELELDSLDRTLDQSKEAFFKYDGNYQKLFPTFGKLIKQYFKSIHLQEKTLEEQWEIISILAEDISSPKSFYTIIWNEEIHFSLIPIGEVIKEEKSCLEGITQFFYTYAKENFIRKEKKRLSKQLEKQRNQTINYIKKSNQKLEEVIEKPGYNQLADILMANMHQIPPHAKEVDLMNFYTNEMVKIPLKSNLSPQKNAENLYRKSKNQKIELQQLEASIKQKEQELEEIEHKLAEVNNTEDIKSLKKLIKQNPKQERAQVELKVPYKKFEYGGFIILVGKGARENDELTLKYAKKNDLWLHAKDVTGSHVVLKQQSNKPFPQDVIEHAAQAAAFYSKRKSDSLSPVIVTPKKYVRKPKGLPPGMVHVDKEDTILVKPEAWWIASNPS
ncbi:NFACT RNA binding domain-containing protein [Marivirga arenosa]|uniref:NFACT RNA binding domain-containing protein n=1 Tax=Marivirga arenosa TaxID=3059076 RepID=A0AA51X4W5_9BACT|nr:NFACT RNA binding domain-containing protein [Marivirga sp. BKB1-2]WNB17176.1 NFACT RNA binding domain-containing protein [Marivirga sp. BKB1-2]